MTDSPMAQQGDYSAPARSGSPTKAGGERDDEMTKLCAEAMGLRPEAGQGNRVPMWCLYASETEGHSAGSVFGRFDPLHDDAQAMALVKRFGLAIHGGTGERWSVSRNCHAPWSYHENLNRAIVECVAKMPSPSPSLQSEQPKEKE